MRKAQTITYEGKTLTLKEWANETGININTIRSRIGYDMPAHDILSKVPHYNRKRMPDGVKNRYQRRSDRIVWPFDVPRPSQGHRKFITLDGVTHSYAEWSVIRGISVQSIRIRFRDGLTPDEVLAPANAKRVEPVAPKPQPPKPHTRMSPITIDGDTRTVERWAYHLDMPVSTILSRLKQGETPEQVIQGRLRFKAQRAALGAQKQGPPTAIMRVPTLAEVDAMRLAA